MSKYKSSKVILCDLDGTLCNTHRRRHLDPMINPESSWPEYAKACLTDFPIYTTINLLRHYSEMNWIHLISGRDSSAITETRQWLTNYCVPYDNLTLRTDNNASNVDIKIDYVRKVKFLGFTPVLLIDDLQEVCEAVAEEGVPTLQIREPGMLPEPEEGRPSKLRK